MDLQELRKEPHWSYSSLNTFINACSLQWAFRYAYKVEAESTSVNLVFGSAFHAVCEIIANHRKDGVYLKSLEVQDAFSDNWALEAQAADNLFLSDEDWQQLNLTGRKMAECLNNEWLEDQILAVNRVFSVPIPNVAKPLIGEMDCIVRNNRNLTTILDWKTAARKWSEGKADKDMQATFLMYAHKLSQNSNEPSADLFRFDVVTKTKEPSYTQHPTNRTQDDFQRMITMIHSVERAIRAEAFLPNETSYYCDGCSYKSACKVWHRNQARKTISLAA